MVLVLDCLVCAYAYYVATSNHRRSVSGMAVLLGDTETGWKSSTQKCVTTAACEAEYVALCDASNKALFTTAVLVVLQPELSGMREDIFCDMFIALPCMLYIVCRSAPSDVSLGIIKNCERISTFRACTPSGEVSSKRLHGNIGF